MGESLQALEWSQIVKTSSVKFVVAISMQDFRAYSFGLRFVGDTIGARALIPRIEVQRTRRHKRPIYGLLCWSAMSGAECPLGSLCPRLHVSADGFALRRSWDRPLNFSRVVIPNRVTHHSLPVFLASAEEPHLCKSDHSPTCLTVDEPPTPPTPQAQPKPFQAACVGVGIDGNAARVPSRVYKEPSTTHDPYSLPGLEWIWHDISPPPSPNSSDRELDYCIETVSVSTSTSLSTLSWYSSGGAVSHPPQHSFAAPSVSPAAAEKRRAQNSNLWATQTCSQESFYR